jgi:hypothetical protein
MLQSFEASETIDRLCQRLAETELGAYEDESELLLDVGEIVTEQISGELGELASVWVSGRDRTKIKPVWAFGADFSPSITVEVGDLPTVAIEVRLASREDGTADPVGVAVGRALVYSLQYSYAVAFVLDRSGSHLHKHWLDSEIESRLWDNHRISVIVRQ